MFESYNKIIQVIKIITIITITTLFNTIIWCSFIITYVLFRNTPPLHFFFYFYYYYSSFGFLYFFSFISFFMMFILIYFYGSICSIIICIFYFVLNVASALWIPQSWNEMSYPGVRFFFWSKRLHKMMRVFFNFFPSTRTLLFFVFWFLLHLSLKWYLLRQQKQLNRKKKKTYKISITRSVKKGKRSRKIWRSTKRRIINK